MQTCKHISNPYQSSNVLHTLCTFAHFHFQITTKTCTNLFNFGLNPVVKKLIIDFMENIIEKKAKLTSRQREFVKFYIDGIYSAKQCAIMAGYAEDSAKFHASKLLNGRDFPLVSELIKEKRDERERKYGVTLIGQLKRLADLSEKAEQEGQFSSAINAEKIRSALGGLTIDRREQNHIHQLDKLSREEIVARLTTIKKEYPHAFIEGNYEKVENVDSRKELIQVIKAKPSEENSLSKN